MMDELYAYRRRLLERYYAIVDDLAARSESISSEPSASGLQQTLTHLLQVEERVFYPAIQRIMHEESPALPVLGPEGGQSAPQFEKRLPELLATYARMHRRMVQLLESQPPKVWGRTGRHPIYGVRTLQWWLERSLNHVVQHLKKHPC